MDYLRDHYPAEGAAAVSQAIGIPHDRVIQQANKCKIKLAPITRQRIASEIHGERMRENNPMFSDDTKQKVHEWWEANPDKKAKRTANFIAGKQQLQRNKPNKLEIKAQHILKEFGVEFEPFAIIKPKFIVDFLIGHLVLQIDGEYWHGHPRCNPLTERQKAQRKRDKDQDKYLTECGYTVVRVWERDVNKKYFHNILNQHGLL